MNTPQWRRDQIDRVWPRELSRQDIETLLDDDEPTSERRKEKAESVKRPLRERAAGELPQKPCK